MGIQIFDTMAGEKRALQPLNAEKLGIYVCGMTVYDRCHLGHGRVMVAFDAIVRYLRYRGFAVNYVRNITDVDDKIFARAAERGVPFDTLTAEMIAAMHADEKELGCQAPDHEPRATENIARMITLINTLITKGAAYQGASGDVYFRVSAFPDYGKLNNRNLDDIKAGARVAVADDKEHPADFVLWKVAKPHEASWESPFGAGRPGWHIECSAMSMDALGETFDIHGGGPDLKFPHHENEIAQSEAATGCTFARYWMHAGAVRVRDEKMSKSLGNFITLEQLFETQHPDVVRFFLLQSQYRSAIAFSDEALAQAETSYTRLLQALLPHTQGVVADPACMAEFESVMDDDFNTPRAIALLFELTGTTDPAKHQAAREIGAVLGLFATEADSLMTSLQQRKASTSALTDAEIDAQLAARQAARTARDFAKADAIRDALAEAGVVIEDGASGTQWHRK